MGLGWGMLTSCSWYVDGWGGACLRSCSWYVDGRDGGGMLTSCSWYVDGWGGVGHVNVMFMVRGNFEKEHVAACCSRVVTLKQQRAKKR